MSDLFCAPVLIPTICRYKHFKLCVDSLSKCVDADKTDLYIGLDYPAKEAHWKGYNKILEYVDSISGFRNVYIFKRDVNFGQKKNMADLRQRAEDDGHLAYIISEDDNEFSQNFLLYMNQCLVKYQHDPRVMAVCGFSHPEWTDMGKYTANAFPMHGFCAYGYGTWFAKLNIYHNFISDKEIVANPKLVHKLFKCRQHVTIHRLLFRQGVASGDLRRRCYAELMDQYSIFPVISKVRNHGFDGEGTTCKKIDWYEKMSIDETTSFLLDDFEIIDDPDIIRLHDIIYSPNWKIRLLSRVEYGFYRLFGCSFHDSRFIRMMQRWRVKHVLNK